MVWAPDYVTLAQAKAARRITDNIDDAEISVYISAASRAIDDHCNRQFGLVAAPEARTYTADYDAMRGLWYVEIDDLQTAVGMVVTADGATQTVTLEPRNAVLKGKAFTHLFFPVDLWLDDDEVGIVAPWGWSAVPISVLNACKLQVSRFAARRDSPFGVAGSPDTGSEMRLLAKLDPDVAVSLRGYRRPRRVG